MCRFLSLCLCARAQLHPESEAATGGTVPTGDILFSLQFSFRLNRLNRLQRNDRERQAAVHPYNTNIAAISSFFFFSPPSLFIFLTVFGGIPAVPAAEKGAVGWE